MKPSGDARFREVMDGSDHSPSAMALRAAAAVAEPLYAGVMRVRNGLYDAGVFKAYSLGRPTVSVGNITTGGTGKTPVVQWLCGKLTAAGKTPVILMRGYGRTAEDISDEAALYASENLAVIAEADRRRGAARAIEKYPQADLFVLDDGMQHRRARRDFDLVLIHAREPFGYGRVFPRGLLREPMAGLRRADAFLITHADEGDVEGVKRELARYNGKVPVFRCNHAIEANLTGKRYFAFCGIGSPESFFRGLEKLGGESRGHRTLSDHFDYRESDVAAIHAEARAAGAEVLVTTEKDCVKIGKFAGAFSMPLVRARLRLEFYGEEGERLVELIRKRIGGER